MGWALELGKEASHEDDEGDVAKEIGSHGDKEREDEDPLHAAHVHGPPRGGKRPGREARDLEALQPHKEAREEEDDRPVYLHHGFVGVATVKDRVCQHGEYGDCQGDEAGVEGGHVGGHGQHGDEGQGAQAQPGNEDGLPPGESLEPRDDTDGRGRGGGGGRGGGEPFLKVFLREQGHTLILNGWD